MDVRDKIYINGSLGALDRLRARWIVIDGRPPRRLIATIPEGTPEDVDKAVRGRRGRLPGLGRHVHRGAGQGPADGSARPLAARTDEIAAR